MGKPADGRIERVVRWRSTEVVLRAHPASLDVLDDEMSHPAVVTPPDSPTPFSRSVLELTAGPSPSTWQILRDSEVVWTGHRRELARRAWSEIHMTLAMQAEHDVFIHAGVVSWKDRSVVVPGTSMSGKTSLVMALLRRGARFLSDEYAVLDGAGTVWPFPRRLHVRVRNGQAEATDPASLGAIDPEPRRIGLVISTRHEPGARWAPERRSGADLALTLVENAVAAQLAPDLVLTNVLAAIDDAAGLYGPRGDADETAAAILAFLDGQPG